MRCRRTFGFPLVDSHNQSTIDAVYGVLPCSSNLRGREVVTVACYLAIFFILQGYLTHKKTPTP